MELNALKTLCSVVGVGRLFLHASKLAFAFSGQNYEFDAPLAEDLARSLMAKHIKPTPPC